MWPEPYHIMVPSMNRGYTSEVKKPFTRTAKTPRYYIIDYGLSRRYSPDDPHPMERLPEGGDRTVPEFGNSLNPTPHDPFAVDIYCLGNVIQKYILDVSRRISHLFVVTYCFHIGLHRLRVPQASSRCHAGTSSKQTVDNLAGERAI